VVPRRSGVNQPFPFTFKLAKNGAVFTYDNGQFFPIDNMGFGNEGNPHNYHFTFELHTEFLYKGGETFTFTGDDDLWTSSTESWRSTSVGRTLR